MPSRSVRYTGFYFFYFCVILALGCSVSHDLKFARQARATGDIAKAFDFYKKFLDDNPKDIEAKEGVRALGPELARITDKTLQAKLNGPKMLSVPDLTNEIKNLHDKKSYDPSGKIFHSLEKHLKTRIKGIKAENLKQAEVFHAALKAKDELGVRNSFRQINQSDPFSKLAKSSGEKAYTFYHDYFPSHVAALMDSGLILTAKEELAEIKDLGFSDEQFSKLHSIYRDCWQKSTHQAISTDLPKGHYYKVYLMLVHGENSDEFASTLASVRSDGAKSYLNKGRSLLSGGDVHYSFLEALKGYELNPDLPGMFELWRDSRDKVAESLQQYIAISAFDSPNNRPNAGPQFSDSLISYLFRILPYGVNIVERQKIDLLLQEGKRDYQDAGKLLNLDLVVAGNVSLLEIDKQESSQQSSIHAKVGEEQQLNPDYVRYSKDDDHSENDVIPEQYLRVPRYETVSYRKGRVTLKGFATVSARIFDAKKSGIIYAQEFNARYETEDDFQDSVEGTNINEEPLELPSETEVQEILRNKVVQQVAAVIQEQFGKRKGEFAKQAKYYFSRKEVSKAMEPLAQGAVYSMNSKLPSGDKDVAEIRNLIILYTES